MGKKAQRRGSQKAQLPCEGADEHEWGYEGGEQAQSLKEELREAPADSLRLPLDKEDEVGEEPTLHEKFSDLFGAKVCRRLRAQLEIEDSWSALVQKWETSPGTVEVALEETAGKSASAAVERIKECIRSRCREAPSPLRRKVTGGTAEAKNKAGANDEAVTSPSAGPLQGGELPSGASTEQASFLDQELEEEVAIEEPQTADRDAAAAEADGGGDEPQEPEWWTLYAGFDLASVTRSVEDVLCIANQHVCQLVTDVQEYLGEISFHAATVSDEDHRDWFTWSMDWQCPCLGQRRP